VPSLMLGRRCACLILCVDQGLAVQGCVHIERGKWAISRGASNCNIRHCVSAQTAVKFSIYDQVSGCVGISQYCGSVLVKGRSGPGGALGS
jgi:hypothetical protein